MVNLNQFVKQAQTMQKKMQEMQEQMAGKEYEGKSGGGLVAIKINGRGECLMVRIDESLTKVEEKEMLEDLVVAAFNDAKQKFDSESQDSLSNTFGGLSLPPGFKMPF
ncbi:YbaB/EbfC family nucleoid-associated protein [Candidatus Trichorickettsia mobilis]|uniref:YbaB/EbfC family nucleoid-associated protein n=1 Tax=Candidatus Trichorickettsia mobilis TaxID=1346319 RepID=UPI0029308905|nr:YbaB/EbfC family nucleoid-associated protein [Candidatus Trichorickettsia mobilis]